MYLMQCFMLSYCITPYSVVSSCCCAPHRFTVSSFAHNLHMTSLTAGDQECLEIKCFIEFITFPST